MSANSFVPQLQSALQGALGGQQQPMRPRHHRRDGWQQPGGQRPWQQPVAQQPAVNPWQQPALQNASGYDANAAARQVAELQAMVNQLTQSLNAALGRAQQPAAVNPWQQPVAQQPAVNPWQQPVAQQPAVNPWQQPVAVNPWAAQQPAVAAQPAVAQVPAAQQAAWLSQLPSWLRPAGVAAAAAPAAVAPVAVAPAAATPPVALAADGRPQALVAAIATYKSTILAESQRTSSMEIQIFSGVMNPTGPVLLLPGLMLPHGVQMLSWAYLGRAATAEELTKYQQWSTAAGSSGQPMKDNFSRIIKDIEDRGVFQKIQQKITAGQPVADLAQEAVAVRQAAAAMLHY